MRSYFRSVFLLIHIKDFLVERYDIFCKHRFRVTVIISDGTGSGLDHGENCYGTTGGGAMAGSITIESAPAVVGENHAERTVGITIAERDTSTSHSSFRHVQFGGRLRDAGCLENGLRSPAFSAIVIELVRCPVSIQ